MKWSEQSIGPSAGLKGVYMKNAFVRTKIMSRSFLWAYNCRFQVCIFLCAGDVFNILVGTESIVMNFSGLDQSEICWLTRLLRALGIHAVAFILRSLNFSSLGIQLAQAFSRRTTHLLCPFGTGLKYDKAKEWDIPVVNRDWLAEIAATGSVPPVSGFLVPPGAASRALVASAPFPSARSLSLSPDSTRLAAGGWNLPGTLQLWDVPSIKASRPLSGGERHALITTLAFSPDCSRLASGSKDGAITLWDTRRPYQPIATQKGHSRVISALAFTPDGGRLASESWDNSIRFRDGRHGGPAGTLKHSFSSPLRAAAFSSDLMAAATENTITLFNNHTLRLAHTLDRRGHLLSFSTDGSFLAFASNNCVYYASNVTVWAVEDHTIIATFRVDLITDRINISPNGSRLALSGCLDGNIKFFDVDMKCPIQQISREDLSWVPHLNGTLISWKSDEHGIRLLGQSIDRPDAFPVLWIPSDVDVNKFAVGSSTFALGTSDGRVLIGQALTSSIC
jgi:hypothetical protein